MVGKLSALFSHLLSAYNPYHRSFHAPLNFYLVPKLGEMQNSLKYKIKRSLLEISNFYFHILLIIAETFTKHLRLYLRVKFSFNFLIVDCLVLANLLNRYLKAKFNWFYSFFDWKTTKQVFQYFFLANVTPNCDAFEVDFCRGESIIMVRI